MVIYGGELCLDAGYSMLDSRFSLLDARYLMLDASAFAKASIFAKATTDKSVDKRCLMRVKNKKSEAPNTKQIQMTKIQNSKQTRINANQKSFPH